MLGVGVFWVILYQGLEGEGRRGWILGEDGQSMIGVIGYDGREGGFGWQAREWKRGCLNCRPQTEMVYHTEIVYHNTEMVPRPEMDHHTEIDAHTEPSPHTASSHSAAGTRDNNNNNDPLPNPPPLSLYSRGIKTRPAPLCTPHLLALHLLIYPGPRMQHRRRSLGATEYTSPALPPPSVSSRSLVLACMSGRRRKIRHTDRETERDKHCSNNVRQSHRVSQSSSWLSDKGG